MKPFIRISRQHVYILSAIALIAGLSATPARAQMLAASGMTTSDNFSITIAQGAGVAVVPSATTHLASVDLDRLSKKEWKQLRREHIDALRTARDEAWEQAAVNVLYLSIYYRDKVNFERASTPLLETYIHDRNTQYRILALGAMHAIGDHDTMAHLVQRVRLEASPRVRHITRAAVADYFGVETPVEPGPSRQIGGSR